MEAQTRWELDHRLELVEIALENVPDGRAFDEDRDALVALAGRLRVALGG